MKILQQLYKNRLSIISLAVAITALSYNTYRNELSENNRNIRYAGFEVLRELSHLQRLIDQNYHKESGTSGEAISGWEHVNYIYDMSYLVSNEVLQASVALKQSWGENWEKINASAQSNAEVSQSINQLRNSVRDTITNLK